MALLEVVSNPYDPIRVSGVPEAREARKSGPTLHARGPRPSRLRSRDPRSDHLEDVLRPTVLRTAQPPDGVQLSRIDDSIRQNAVIDMQPDRFAEEYGVVRDAHDADQTAFEVHRRVLDSRGPDDLRGSPGETRFVKLAHVGCVVTRGDVHFLRD